MLRDTAARQVSLVVGSVIEDQPIRRARIDPTLVNIYQNLLQGAQQIAEELRRDGHTVEVVERTTTERPHAAILWRRPRYRVWEVAMMVSSDRALNEEE